MMNNIEKLAGWSIRPLLVPLSVLVLGSLGCDNKSATAEQSTAAEAHAASQGSNAQPVSAASGNVEPNSMAARCPAGRWQYDYSDQALDVLLKNLPGAKVLKKEGKFVCDISGGTAGTMTCATQGEPVLNVVEVKQAGMRMTVSVELEGKAITKYTQTGGKTLNVVSSDVSQLKMETSMRLAGAEVPFPAEQLVNIFGNEGTVLSYKCEDGKLAIKPEVADTEATWQEFTPL